MKKLVLTLLSLSIFFPVLAQTDGISYQAVIIDPVIQELPGRDISGNILPNRKVALRFTVYDANNATEYQEVHVTTTDQFGMVNLIIGQGAPTGNGLTDFTLMDWDGTSKNLQVEINFSGATSDFENMARQELTFVPYAYHRNITATGDMIIDGTTDLNGRLLVQGPTSLNSTLNVNNQNTANLSGTLMVGGDTDLGGNLTVAGISNFSDSLTILGQSPTFFSGDITVAAAGTATFNGPTVFNSPANFAEINVDGPSNLSGQVIVNANLDAVGGQNIYEAYPMLVQGSTQGIAIKVNGERSIDNNYISFWDQSTGEMWGRIEGITLDELHDDPEYKIELGTRITDVAINGVDALIAFLEWGQGGVELTAALTSSTACGGLGACVTVPIPSFITSKSINLVLKAANIVSIAGNVTLAVIEEESFRNFSRNNIGVSYQSGAGDYAEWLPKLNPGETFYDGQLVGVTNGYVTSKTWGVEKIMIISTNPIVLGNMPQLKAENAYAKIAFMGQVPARVLGQVKPGDYILPSELGNGFGRAIDPKNMELKDYRKIAGVAWSVISEITKGVKLVNVAVGLNTNDLSDVLYRQNEELKALKTEYYGLQEKLNEQNSILSDLIPGYADALGLDHEGEPDTDKSYVQNTSHGNKVPGTFVKHDEDDIVYFEISDNQIEASLNMAREIYQNVVLEKNEIFARFAGDQQLARLLTKMEVIPLEEHPFWKRIDEDPAYKKDIIEYIKSTLEKSMHTHQRYAKQFTDLKIKN